MPDGPYETYAEAHAASLWAKQAPDRAEGHADINQEAVNWADLTGVLEEAHVDLGAYDRRIVQWLAQWEPATVAVICGLISRAALTNQEDLPPGGVGGGCTL